MNKNKKDKFEKYKATIPKQIGKYLATLAMTMLVIIFAGSYMIFSFDGILQKVACIILVLIYALSLYATTYEFGYRDTRSFSALNPHVLKGFAFGLIPAVYIAICWAGYAFVWKDGLSGIFDYVVNILFVFSIFQYYSFAIPYHGYVMIYGITIAILLPVLVSGLGYIAGMHEFDLKVFFRKYIYEKKDADKLKNK